MARPSVITAAPSNKRGKLEKSLGRLDVNGHHQERGHRTATVTRHSSFGGSITSPSVSSQSSTSSQGSDRTTASKLQILSHGSSSDEETNDDPVAAHFKRSLGRSYSEVIRSKSYPISSCSSITSPKSASGSCSSSSASKQENSDGITDRASKLHILSHGDTSDEESNEDPVAAHFRRSLGSGYSELMRGKSSSLSSTSPASAFTSSTASKSDSGSCSSSTGSSSKP
jgi:hypothetical protein